MCAGRIKSDSNKEIVNTIITTIGMNLNIFPKNPGTKYNGKNATIFVKILKITG